MFGETTRELAEKEKRAADEQDRYQNKLELESRERDRRS